MNIDEVDELTDDQPTNTPSTETDETSTETDETSTEPDEAAAENTELSSEKTTSEAEPAKPWWGRAVALGIAAVVFVALGVAFEIRAHSLRSPASVKNHALSDTAATSEVISQVSAALNKVLSYDYQNPAGTEQASSQLLTGDASNQYKTLFTALQQKAPGEKLTLRCKVVVAGVTQLHGNTAQLLVFLDQSSTRASDKQSSTSAAQLDITAVKQGDTWKISELLPL